MVSSSGNIKTAMMLMQEKFWDTFLMVMLYVRVMPPVSFSETKKFTSYEQKLTL